jgi:hypothetical protein
MHAELIRAIDHKFLVSFYYHHQPCLVFPCCYGIDVKQNRVLRGYRSGEGWNNYLTLQMKGFVVTNHRFDCPPARYKQDNEDMGRVIAQLGNRAR